METHDTESNQNIRIFLVGSCIKGRITDYESLQKYEIFGWKTQRLLWIGYQKNMSNVKCHLSCLPKDVIKYIITFCSIYHKNNPQLFVEHTTKDTKLQDIVCKYRDKQVHDKHAKEYFYNLRDRFVTVRVWCQWRCINKFYNWKKQLVLCKTRVPKKHKNQYKIDSCTKMTKNKNAEKKRYGWVEIPSDCLDVRMDHKMFNFIDCNQIVIELLSHHNHKYNNSKPKNITYLPNMLFYWPLAKVDFNYQDLQVGDIVDVKVKLCLPIF